MEEGIKLDDAYPGQRLHLRNRPFVVEERGHARVTAAEGQLPSDVDPTEDHYYVDATGPKGMFASLDFGPRGQDPRGLPRPAAEAGAARHRAGPAATAGEEGLAAAGAVSPVQRRAGAARPGQTKRVACPFCGALLDASQGKLAFLRLLEKPEHPPRIALGDQGQLDGAEWICIGFMVRSCTVEGTRYPWEEYLLFHKERGFTWLMESNGHWVYLEPIDAGEVSLVPGVAAHYEGRRYKAFQSVDRRHGEGARRVLLGGARERMARRPWSTWRRRTR